jgi:hypothetical protein
MSRDPEDDDHTTFIQLGVRTPDGKEQILSRAAFQLHTHGIVESVNEGTPGFVSDDYLNAVSAETTLTAAELCAAGLWRRADGGYEVVDKDMVTVAADFSAKMDRDAEFCQATGGHESHDDNPDLCKKCGAWRPSATDWPAG